MATFSVIKNFNVFKHAKGWVLPFAMKPQLLSVCYCRCFD